MHKQSILSLWSARVVEACWLLALTLIPIYFNLFSARHFEPDKATTLRSLALIGAAVALARGLEWLVARGEDAPTAPGETKAEPGPSIRQRFAAFPLALPVLIYALVFLLTTATSVLPGVSFWGSYQRMQGTYTNLSYILIFILIVTMLRRREQIERIVTITLATATAVACYGILQHQHLDPLPWRGDVTQRVASTMGNSIFVAAYMIMVVPLALYRMLSTLSASRSAPQAIRPRDEWLWSVARGLFLLGGLLLLLMAVKFGAAVRTVDFRYWWVLAGAVVCATALWWMLTVSGERVPIWPGLLTMGYLLVFGAQFALSAGSGEQALIGAADAPNAVDWWIWLLLSCFVILAGYGLALWLPPLPAVPSRLRLQIEAAVGAATALLLGLAIFLTQSRGPWIGLGAGLFVFVTLLLWQGLRQARARDDVSLAGRLRALLIGWVAITVMAGGFLVVFNLSNAPIFQRLRQVPYIGRMGQLLEVDSGTGLVRRLIWSGDAHGGGAIALITSNPLRTVIGWGPESMFVAFNPFFPPSLANVEARGASPDRSHQAILDELVTKGALGLASYLFLLFSFATLGWQLIRRSERWEWQVFFIAMLSAVTATFVEGLTGIPIVSTLMMFWVILGITVAAARVAVPAAEAPRRAVATGGSDASEQTPSSRRGGQKPATRRGGPAAGRARTPAPRRAAVDNPGALALYASLLVVALGLAWWLNVSPVYADMRFQQGQGISERAGLDLNRLVQVLDEYLATVRANPREDFYYLNLGRVLMSISDGLRMQGVEPGEADSKVKVEDLLRLDQPDELVSFVEKTSPMVMMSYAEAVLLRAHDLNPLNKDHFANLGRLNSYWSTWMNDPSRLQKARDWYEQVAAIAPNDVTLVNERADVVRRLGDYAAANGDPGQAGNSYQEAAELLQFSVELDAKYPDTYMRLGELARSRDGSLDAAAAQYLRAIDLSALYVADSAEQLIRGMEQRPDLIKQLRDAFAAQAARADENLARAEGQPERAFELPQIRQNVALLYNVVGLYAVRSGDVAGSIAPYARGVALQPDSLGLSRNYTLVLSDTQRYDDAIAEVNRLIGVLQKDQRSSDISQAQQLLQMVQQARPAGAP